MELVNPSTTKFEKVFPEAERPRVHEGSLRYQILVEDFDDIVLEYLDGLLGPEKAAMLPPPDTSRNPVVSVCRALSTPGHYGCEPSLAGDNADVVAKLVRDVWPMKQQVEFLANGLQSCATLQLWPAGATAPVFELVPPHGFYVVPDPHDPRRIREFFHLRVRRLEVAGVAHDAYCWDHWSIADEKNPTFRVRVALEDGRLGADLTASLFPGAADEYPCRYDGTTTGRPFIPYVVHRAREDGTVYGPWTHGRGGFRATLAIAALSTFSMKLAHDATGETHIGIGIQIRGLKTRRLADGSDVPMLPLFPNEMVFADPTDGSTNPQVVSIGGGGALAEVVSFQKEVASSAAIDMGVTPSDASKTGNPMSGVAIHLTNAQKRDEQRRQTPLCRAADEELVRQVIGLALAAEVLTAPPGPITVTYDEIAKSPDEERADREGDEWEVKMGLASLVDLYMEEHPGVDAETATKELARIAADRARVEKLAAEASGGAKPQPMQIGQMDAMVGVLERAKAGTIGQRSAAMALVRILQCSEDEANDLLADSIPSSTPTPAAPPAA